MYPEVERAEAHKTGHKWIDIMVALCALVVSGVSLFVAVMHGRTMERMAEANAALVKANSWPLIESTTGNHTDADEPVITLGLVNGGVGPAKVETFEVFWNGQPVRNNRELLAACCGLEPGMLPSIADAHGSQAEARRITKISLSSSKVSGRVIMARDGDSFLTLPLSDPSAPVFDKLNTARLKVEMRVCYCSVFDECWLSDLKTMNPPQVKACPAPKVPFEN
jgi:hypothetical protein